MKKVKLILLNFCVINMLIFCSCSQIPNSFAQELTQSNWEAEFKNGTKVALTFLEDNKAKFDIVGDYDNSCTISGVCTVSEKAFVISDISMAKNISMEYKLYGNKVEITYMGETISLDKIVEKKGDISKKDDS